MNSVDGGIWFTLVRALLMMISSLILRRLLSTQHSVVPQPLTAKDKLRNLGMQEMMIAYVYWSYHHHMRMEKIIQGVKETLDKEFTIKSDT